MSGERSELEQPKPGTLVCAECDRRSSAMARGWVGLRADDHEDRGAPEVAIFCPVCARREFG
jgi:hypothetical protein